jgi:diguanylate cyclase (GGDEF)-like protein
MSTAVPSRPARARRLATPRLVAALALFAISAFFFCAIAGYALVRQADERQELARRAALLGAIEDIRGSTAGSQTFDPAHIRTIERVAALKDLRFESTPAVVGREIQPALDREGRILGWFSWQPNASMSDALGELLPLLVLTGLLLMGFAAVALRQVRRAMVELSGSERLAWTLAHEDMLTGLATHRKMIERIDAQLAARAPVEVVTLVLIDIDGLKDINDALGHRSGDALLIAFAERLQNLLPSRAHCGRLDGDEFAVMTVAPDADSAHAAVEALAGALVRPFSIAGETVQIGISTGLAHVPRDAQTRDELVRRADLALRAAKRKRRGSLVAFERAMDIDFDDRRFLDRELKRALAEQTLDVHYQPIVSADGARIVGAEALLRWQHPVRGAIPPADFVPVAEHAGLMKPLGDFVLRRALAEARRWPGLFMSVNLSPVQVRDPAMVEQVAGLLAEHGVPAARLLLEITEGVLIDNPQEAEARLEALRALGVRIALDDFGTGYSSLSYLQRFRLDKLKIDRSFVEPLGHDPNSRAMVQAIIALGRALGLGLVAEGVETEEQRVLLRLAGCDQMQGFLFASAGPPQALDALLEKAGPGNPPARRAA